MCPNVDTSVHFVSVGDTVFSSGRFYFEVQVSEETSCYFGFARESIKGEGDIVTTSSEMGLWTLYGHTDGLAFFR